MGANKKIIFIFTVLVLIGALAIVFYFHRPPENKVRQVIISTIKKPLVASAQAAQTPVALNISIPILMYHHVGTAPAGADATTKDLTVPTANFQLQVAWLYREGYHSITLNNLYKYSKGQFKLPAKPIIFTFDDGYTDVFQNAVPILKNYGYTGSFGIITSFPGTTLGINTYATWNNIASAQSQGMEIVCHTQNHFDGTNPKFTPDYIFQNLSGCKKDLAQNGIQTNILVYPYGHYNQQYIEQAQKAGFIMGITTHESDKLDLKNIMQLPRVRVHGAEDLQRFEDIVLDAPAAKVGPTTASSTVNFNSPIPIR